MEATAPHPLPAPPRSGGGAVNYLTWRTPLVFLAIYCLISSLLQENYPISHYPMYSNPSADRSYYIVADASTGKPLPIATVSGITCPKIGKIWRGKVETLTKKTKTSKDDLSPEQKQQIGQAIFNELRGHAKDNTRSGMPERLTLQRVDILYRDGILSEVPTTLATEPAVSNLKNPVP